MPLYVSISMRDMRAELPSVPDTRLKSMCRCWPCTVPVELVNSN